MPHLISDYPEWQKTIREHQVKIALQSAKLNAERQAKQQQEDVRMLRKALEDTGITLILASPHVIDGYSFYIAQKHDYQNIPRGDKKLCISCEIPASDEAYNHIYRYETSLHEYISLDRGTLFAYTTRIADAIDKLDKQVEEQVEINQQIATKQNGTAHTFTGDTLESVLAQVMSEIMEMAYPPEY